jgi:multidrug efflux pump subunit AcrA (membrane-fusion protein)
VSGRDPDAILADLGRELRAAWARPRRRSLLPRHWRRGIVLALAALALVPTALATHDAIWAPDPPPLPDAVRPPGAVAPEQAGAQVYVARGDARGIAWQLTASACDYGTVRAVGVFLTVPGGGGGARCDVASRLPGAGVSPRALARRLVQTYFDPVSGRTWAFGALPAAARTVDVSAVGAKASVAAVPADRDAVVKGGLPPGMRVFVAILDGARDVPLVTVRDASGAALLVCREGRCAQPKGNP